MPSIAEAIAYLQDAQKSLVAATEALNGHNISLEAHEDIRKLIDELKNSETIYTKQQIVALVKETIAAHVDKPFQEAHPGWEEYASDIEKQLASIAGRLTSLESWRDNGASETPKTDLEKALQAVEDKYAPILQSLQNAFRDAEKQGNTALSDEIKKSIAVTLDQKKDELLKVMKQWQEENNKPS